VISQRPKIHKLPRKLPEVEPLMGKFAYKILIGAALCVGHEATPSAVAEVREAVYMQGSTCRQRLREKELERKKETESGRRVKVRCRMAG
jgi:hypothetical protein